MARSGNKREKVLGCLFSSCVMLVYSPFLERSVWWWGAEIILTPYFVKLMSSFIAFCEISSSRGWKCNLDMDMLLACTEWFLIRGVRK